jgi:hypothetical protein
LRFVLLLGIVVGLPLFGSACGRLAGPLPLLAVGAIVTALSIALILYGPASYLVFSLGMFFCGIANGSYALTFVVVGASVPRRYTCATFGFANLAILAVGGLFLTFDRDSCANARGWSCQMRLSSHSHLGPGDWFAAVAPTSPALARRTGSLRSQDSLTRAGSTARSDPP